MDVDGEAVRLAGQHGSHQPAHVRRVGGARRVQRLLEVALDDRVVVGCLEVQRRVRDQRAQPQRRLPRGGEVAAGVELTEDLPGAGGRDPPGVGARGIEAPPQQGEDLLAVEQPRRQPERVEAAAHRVGVREALAHRAAMVGQPADEQRPGQPPAAATAVAGGGEQGAARVAGARQVRDDHERPAVHRGPLVGVLAQRGLHRPVQPPARQRQPVAHRPVRGRGRAGERLHLAPAAGEDLREVDGARLDVELKRLRRSEARHEPAERLGGALAVLVGEDQRVRRRDLEHAHERALARDEQAGVVDRLDRQQVAGLPQLRIRAGATGPQHRHSSSRSTSIGAPITAPVCSVGCAATR